MNKGNWNEPVLKELDINKTEYSFVRTSNVDGTYTSFDGKFTNDTYGVSGGNNGTPEVIYQGNDPKAVVR